MNLYNSTFNNNSARYGGAFYVVKGDIYIDGSKFNHNNASSGGAIYVNSTSTFNFINSTLNGNNATKTGVINLITVKNVNLINSTFINNTGEQGGVLYSYNSPFTVNVNGSTFINNNATQEGGCFYILCNGVIINNSTFISNKTSKEGGVLYNIKTYDGDDNLTIFYSNLINNTALSGASIYTGYSHFTNISYSNFTGNNVTDEASVMY